MPTFTDRELDVMTVLWERGPSTAAEVRETLEQAGLVLAYNTVLTVLRILEDKGHVGHAAEGRAHRFHARVAREAAGASAVRRLLGTLFGGSPELLLTHLVRDRSVTRADVRRLRDLLDAELGDDADADASAGAPDPKRPAAPRGTVRGPTRGRNR